MEIFETPTIGKEQIFNCLNSDFTKIYLEFMSYALELLTDFNKLFQTEKPLLHVLQPEVEKLITTIASNYLQFSYTKTTDALKIEFSNTNYFLLLEKMYLGVLAQTLADLKENSDEINIFKKNCQSFYIEVIKQIRVKFDFSDEIFEVIKIVNPSEAQSFNDKDLTNLLNKFPNLTNFVNKEALHKEWRDHALLNHNQLGLNPNLSADEYWEMVFSLKNIADEPLFNNLRKAVYLIFILPFSNACVERIFSQLKLLKTGNRNRLDTDTIAALTPN